MALQGRCAFTDKTNTRDKCTVYFNKKTNLSILNVFFLSMPLVPVMQQL